ncbi:MAG: hypothetical protein R8J84_00505 [Mariprofundales bacterium]
MLALIVAGCSEMPKLFWDTDEGKGVNAVSGTSVNASSRAPLVVPPELQGKVEVPMPQQVAPSGNATHQGASIAPVANKPLVAGKAVALDARVYPVAAAPLFSAVVDAMTALNIPVESVDSPSGTVTSDWIRKDAASSIIAPMANLFGGGGAVQSMRYRFVVRVLRQQVGDKQQSRLEVRTLGQVFTNRHWMNKPLKRKLSNELFSAVEERISSQPGMEPQV